MALYFIIGIGVIIGAYLTMAYRELEFADSSFMINSLLNQTEAAAEEATWAIINEDWTGWTVEDPIIGLESMRKKVTGIDLGNGKSGNFYIIVEDYNNEAPVIYVEARTTMPGGRVISKHLKIELTGNSLLGSGIIVKDALTFSGDINLDCYDSSIGPYNVTTNRNANLVVGSISTSPAKVNISFSNIWGYVGTAGPAATINSTNSTVKGPETPVGVDVDPNRLSTSLTAQFQNPTNPTLSAPITDLPGGNSLSGTTIVTIGDTTLPIEVEEYVLTSDLSLANSSKLVIEGPVVIVMDPDMKVDVSGTAQIQLTSGGSLTVYIDGDFTVSGGSMINDTAIPLNLIIYSTETVALGQNITLSGDADLHAVVYAPNARTTISGGTNTYGAVVAYDITMSGGASFHYDENLTSSFGGSISSLEMTSWREIVTATERANIQSILLDVFGSGTYP